MTWIFLLLGLLFLPVLLLAVYLAIPFRRPFPTESDYSHRRTPWWQIYYVHRYVRPVKGAEKGSGLEDYFRSMRFDFERPALSDSREITVKASGDLMGRRDLPVGPDAGSRLWHEMGEFMFTGDLRIGNLECAVNPDQLWDKLIRFSFPPSYVEALLADPRFGRFDVVTLANNHINDSFSDGMGRTCEYLEAKGFPFVGANRTPEEQDRFPIFDVKGLRIAVLSYTFSTNGLPLEPGKEYGTNVVRFNALRDEDYDPGLILRHIRLARERGADYIVSCHHWGIEFEYYPTRKLVARAHALFEAGLDLIVGHHPHILKPTERYRTRDGRDCICFYSLGNTTTAGLVMPIQNLSQLAGVVLEAGRDREGRLRAVPVRVLVAPFIYSRRRVAGVLEQRLLSLTRAREALRAGRVPEGLDGRQIRLMKRLGTEYDRFFLPSGADCR
jgi:poly-gamma-glutamate synthesis protein (capsule biosynthesis protein)